MMATQHAVVQAKAYVNTLTRRTTNVAKPALLDAPIAKKGDSLTRAPFSYLIAPLRVLQMIRTYAAL